MNSTNELIFVNNILTAKLTIRKAAKQLGLRRDDLIRRIKEMLKNDEENIKKLDLIIITNKILYDNLSAQKAAKTLHISEKELDKKISILLENNVNKKKRYELLKNKYYKTKEI